ncbi:MAG: DUF3422 domain-containing protein [Burkholderiaceae bacterium]
MTEPRLPIDHPLRRELADEVHARPPVAVPQPAVVSALALLTAPGDDAMAPLAELARRNGIELALPQHAQHLVVEIGPLHIKCERHTEFVSYTFVQHLPGAELSALEDLPSAFDALPADWLSSLPGKTIAALDIVMIPGHAHEPTQEELARLFPGPGLVGSQVADGAAWVFSDFQLTPDGRGRWLVLDWRLAATQRARLVQRLVEISTYRVMALLAFPLARERGRILMKDEQRLSAITEQIADLGDHASQPVEVEAKERKLLDDLTQLAAEAERAVASTSYRYAAAQAYWDLVTTRLQDMREARLGGVPTVAEFLGRRLEPAMATVAAMARRQQELSARVARASELLRTRVDIAREEQNQKLMAAMDRRGKLSLRLQQTVEGLSVAALTYYGVGLVGYLAKPIKELVPGFEPEWAMAAAVPLLGLLVWRGVHRVRQELMKD